MSDRSMKVAASALAIVLRFSGVGAIVFSEGAIAQDQNTSEIDRAIDEGRQLFKEGGAESLRKAIPIFTRALKLAKSERRVAEQALPLYYLGRINDNLGNKNEALKFYAEALLICDAIKDLQGKSLMLHSMASIHDDLGDKERALYYYNQALPIRYSINDKTGQAVTLNNIGLVYSDLGEKQKALEYYNKALSIIQVIGDQLGQAATLNNIGLVYSDLGQKQKALEYYQKSLIPRRIVGDRFGEASTLTNIGLIYSDLKDDATALKNYNQALELRQVVGDRFGEASTLGNIGLAYLRLKEGKRSLDYLNRSLLLRRELNDRRGEGITLFNIGGAYIESHEEEKAIKYYSESLLILQAIGARQPQASLLHKIADLLNNRKQIELSIAFYKQSINITESLRKDIRKLPRETQEIYTSSVANTYRELADILLTRGRIREAQSILELLKVQELQVYGKNEEANVAPIQFPLHPLESQVLQAFEKSIASNSLTLETLNTIGQPLTQNRDRITQDMNAMPIAIGNPQAVLKANPNALLIQNLVVGDKIWVLWTNASGNTKAIVVPNVTQKELTTTVETFRKQIGSPYSNLNELKVTSQKLHNWLIPPELQAELKNNPRPQLLFSLDHVTRYIPVAALYDGTQYLAQRYTLSNLITMDSDMDDRLTLQGRSPNILALGTTNAYPGFDALPNVQAELDAIVKESNDSGIFPGTVRLNAAFTADSLRGKLDAYRVLHIATHGSFNPKSITASFLLLGNGDKLPITDIAGLTNLANNHLVVLSACETGLSGVSPDGSEISGISGYFLRRGAKSVMASLWAVNDASTALLMQQFYNRLSQGMTKAAAIQAVQQDFISGKLTASEAKSIARAGARPDVEGQLPPDSFSHPYFWAPFILIGNNL
jgi:CHAT domain-containing protein